MENEDDKKEIEFLRTKFQKVEKELEEAKAFIVLITGFLDGLDSIIKGRQRIEAGKLTP